MLGEQIHIRQGSKRFDLVKRSFWHAMICNLGCRSNLSCVAALTLQHVHSGPSSHLQDCSSMHLLTMEAHTASLQPRTPCITIKLVITITDTAITPPTVGTLIYKHMQR